MEMKSATTAFFDQLAQRSFGALRHEDLHIVDQLINERGHTLILGYVDLAVKWPLPAQKCCIIAKRRFIARPMQLQGMTGLESFAYVSQMLKLKVPVVGFENIPSKGGFILVSNHPTGIADGIAVYDMMKNHRSDLVFFANRDAVRVNPNLAEIIIPVEWRKTEKTMAKSRQTLVQTNQAFAEGRAIVLFPSGRLAYWNEGRLTERPWMATAVQLAKRYNVPIIPMNMKARNSGLFYLLAHRNPELRDMTVFHELLNKVGKTFEMTIGSPIDVSTLEGDVQDLTVTLQRHCEITLRDDPRAGSPF
ncbi:MAG: 1-acyl-sn-glycerol-3-phosphate acyltransferase [Ahrensia sp.]|nr:1-acyl-sn-glycerol-3-phosphate acyltransferase [Ahrensia sp.]